MLHIRKLIIAGLFLLAGSYAHALYDGQLVVIVATGPVPVGVEVFGATVTVQGASDSLTVDATSPTFKVSGFLIAHSTGGIDGIYQSTSVVATGVSVTATPTKIYSIQASNTNSTSNRYLKLYNKASAPTVGTDAQYTFITIPPSSTVGHSFANIGLNFSLGVGVGATTGPESTNSTAPSANEVQCVIYYINDND